MGTVFSQKEFGLLMKFYIYIRIVLVTHNWAVVLSLDINGLNLGGKFLGRRQNL